jgi:hypothetical protein
MVLYTCENCNKIFTKKSTYVNHVQKKKYSCVQTHIVPPNLHLFTQNAKNLPPNLHLFTPNYNIDDSKNTIITYKIIEDDNTINNSINCNFCFKIFSRKDVLKKHLNICKEKKSIENEKDKFYNLLLKKDEQIEKLIKQNKKLQEQVVNSFDNSQLLKDNNINNGIINNNTINTVNNGIVNNIKIKFGKEDLTKLGDDFFIKTLLNFTGAQIPCKIIEGIHFNPYFMENMNVYISDISRNKAMIHDGEKWNVANADETVSDLYQKAVSYCVDRNEELHDKIEKKEKIKKKIDKEMNVIDIMTNNEIYKYNKNGEPINIDGKIVDPNELRRGKCLNMLAKEHITKSLYNNKYLINNKK